jgi:UDP-glucose 4-epimerase
VLKKASGGTSNVVHAAARAGEQRRSVVRNEKAARVLGWRPQIALADGLRDTFEWFTARRAEKQA